ncbi:hypothetical protein H112_04793 [Trichophyton rubrum D6]|uniref:Uncharacterized protein n=3 Tax=Trichophyton TaxID=5550 RepID=F2SNP7_TRIRC|nr:uncharacterized protein TERG_04557 [Trichophyton rubrum CBS 118892]EZF22342.1 hypothetical protein H100_04802 [Trichophyton rubrum MR850]EZF41490.1 hypothetical protein H102_04789 [Trichophyton rubrum CBS 100081]EZF52064.1 hypothetical protein H103_04793 [Trichophyton rubrum CBS 288.86]EZF62721.1 hypothetical protein H104_04780 [Trichophyton rubrum CBS 289.86]EZF73344.1 hypothetical protein H105_04810 [Trichophyton soudanense CBS 452.61]EZF83968.1 hypothetical protein H110_04789 [Trichophy
MALSCVAWRATPTTSPYIHNGRQLLRPILRRRVHSEPSSSSRMRLRLQSFNNCLPKFLRSYTTPLFNAPVTHITSFLILHELTAVIPLFGLVGVFHYGGWLPSLGNSNGTSPVDEGVRKFGKWLRKRGWVQDVEDMSAMNKGAIRVEDNASELTAKDRQGLRLILEFATAYAITKALLPVRIAWSVWATPWFARTVVGPVGRAVGRLASTNKGR